MSLSARKRRKGAAQAAKLLPPRTTTRTYVVGRRPWRWTQGAKVLVFGFVAVSVAVLVLFGVILVPGGLLALLVYNQSAPMRAIVVTDDHVAVMHRRTLDSRPNRLLAWAPHRDVAVRPAGSKTEYMIGGEVVRLASKEDRELSGALTVPPAIAYA